jgi:uncharacterized DUF497 family protein
MPLKGFEWDEQSKTGLNFRNHGVRIPEAIPVVVQTYRGDNIRIISAPSGRAT